MGLFEKIFKRPKPAGDPGGYFRTLSAYTPVFTSFGGSIYESDLVRAAIHARANHISKLSVEVLGTAQPALRASLRTGPNPWQTWGQFLYRLATILDMQNTAFIVPVLDEFERKVGLFPVLPSQCSLQEYNGEAWLRYFFRSGETAAIELESCGIMTKFQYRDDFLGENNAALMPTMDLIAIQNQGIQEGVKSAATYRFMANVTNFSKADDLAKERKRFNQEHLSGEGGVLLLFPNTYSNIQQIDSKPFVVDAAQMQSIKDNVYTYFGVNEDILQNKAFGDAWSAFYEGAIEPFAIQFSDVASRMMFSERERALGAKIMATANRLQYMTNGDKLKVSAQMADRGLMSINEIREIWNLPPVENGDRRIIRGEYYDADSGETEKGDDSGGDDPRDDQKTE